jgi:hypothetical protein
MRKLAARDFEDLLQVSFSGLYHHALTVIPCNQCAIPVFEGLLPSPHNEIVTTLLFELATWHALAKLRLHTDTTLGLLTTSTIRLGKNVRTFLAKTCTCFNTTELPQEESARRRQMTATQLSRKQMAGTANTGKKKSRLLNLSTYKLHALGDYVDAIRRYGTSDNYSTQIVSYLTCSKLMFIDHPEGRA